MRIDNTETSKRITSMPDAIKPEVHFHNKQLEGPLPEGFPIEGREGKVRNIYVYGQQICLIASDRVSAFDQVSPTPIPGKGAILNDIARRELVAAEAAGIPTWFRNVPENNPRAAVGELGVVQPVELIFRNYMTGSMWREYKATGDFTGLGLPSGWVEWQDFTDAPLFTPSTKGKTDVNLNTAALLEYTGLEPKFFADMEEMCRELFRLGTARATERGLTLVDTKYEVIVTPDGKMKIGDEVHTPDSSRFVMAEGFAEAVARGETPRSLSKEFLRGIMLERARGDIAAAKELMKDPLPSDVVEETASRYNQLHAIFAN
jgi:phosphoribosylaminoimidazole-succinocarboxamide synthase